MPTTLLTIYVFPTLRTGRRNLNDGHLDAFERVRSLAVRREIGEISDVDFDREATRGIECAWFTVRTDDETHVRIVVRGILGEVLPGDLAHGICSWNVLARWISGTLLGD